MSQNDQNINKSTNDPTQNTVNSGVNNNTNPTTNPNNQQPPRKMKTSYLVLIGIGICLFLLVVISVSIFVFSHFNKLKDTADHTQDQANEIIDNATDLIDSIIDQGMNDSDQTDTSESEKKAHNASFEVYEGTQSGTSINILLQQVAINNEIQNDRTITVIYDTTTTNDSNQITALKQNIDSSKNYEVSFDYDSNGFISKVTIQ